MNLIVSYFVTFRISVSYEISGYISQDSKVEIEIYLVFEPYLGKCTYDYFLLMKYEEKNQSIMNYFGPVQDRNNRGK